MALPARLVASRAGRGLAGSATPSPIVSFPDAESVLIYDRGLWRLTAAGGLAFANALCGALVGAYLLDKASALPQDDARAAKRGILALLGAFVGLVVPGVTLPAWWLFSRGVATRLALYPRARRVGVSLLGFLPGTRRSLSLPLSCLVSRQPLRHARSTPTLVTLKAEGSDVRQLGNLQSIVFERRPGAFRDEPLFHALAEGRLR